MKKLLLLVCAFVFVSCSGSKLEKRKLEISHAAISSADFLGGALVEIVDSVGVVTAHTFTTPPFIVTLPDGVFSIRFAGFVGPSAWQGTYECGGVTNLNLTATDTEIKITVNAANCANVPYPAMVAAKLTNWDSALWDTAQWAP